MDANVTLTHATRCRRRLLVLLLAALVSPAPPAADTTTGPAPGPRDVCPVCGMFVTRYPEWTATLVHADGHTVHFDGAKDLFKYRLDLDRYAAGRAAPERLLVTEYYGLARIDARGAWYVIGSDVLGPMGHELIPFSSRAEAEEFSRDHKGKGVLRYEEIDRSRVESVDLGRFE